MSYLSSSPQPVTDCCLSGHLNSRRSSIKVTRVATNVLAEQTMSRQADGGAQLRGRTMSGEAAATGALPPRDRRSPYGPFASYDPPREDDPSP